MQTKITEDPDFYLFSQLGEELDSKIAITLIELELAQIKYFERF